MKKEKEEIEEPSAPFWMVTFSDMVTLLLVFFILILSYSTIELEKFKGAMSSMKGALGVLPEMGSMEKTKKIELNKEMEERREEIYKRMETLGQMMKDMKLEGMVELDYSASGIHIRLGDNVLFDPGKARLKPKALKILAGIAQMVKGMGMEIYVEGHTDNVPIHTSQFPSNWELSTARALSVVRYLHDIEGIPAEHLAAVGHGEHRPLVPNDSPQGRAKNRRVEIFIKWLE
ncbi:MAG TPA: hypothetical protein ENK44_05495 [Caldithrix abyssi]|uniref:OmpA-like domain-containing protein n=1 Tax=Caldithrix abyssi TaxID=187145 RepID=A0A7V4TZA0_CALAY|nr:hypothetical protein [Caldithrix abyssi]